MVGDLLKDEWKLFEHLGGRLEGLKCFEGSTNILFDLFPDLVVDEWAIVVWLCVIIAFWIVYCPIAAQSQALAIGFIQLLSAQDHYLPLQKHFLSYFILSLHLFLCVQEELSRMSLVSFNKGRKWHYLGHFLIASELANKPVHGQFPLFCHSSIAGSHISTKRTTAHLIVIISKNHQYPFLPLTSYLTYYVILIYLNDVTCLTTRCVPRQR